MLCASSAAAEGRSQRAEGTRKLSPAIFRHILVLGTASQGSIPFHGWAGLRLQEAQLKQGFWDIVIHAPYGPRESHISPACLTQSFQGHSQEGSPAREYTEGFLGFLGLRSSN